MTTLTFGASSGNWQTDAAWVGGVKPTAADDVLLTAASGACTIDSGAVCRSLNLTGYVSTLTHNVSVTLTIGDATAGLSNVALEFPTSGWTYTPANVTAAIAFVSTSATQQTVNFGGQVVGNVTFNATSNGSWQYTGAQAGTGTLTLTKGSLDLNGQTVTTRILDLSNANVRSLTLGAATINLDSNTTPWIATTTTNLTFSGASATINVGSGTGPVFAGGGLTYGTVKTLSAAPVLTITGANTFTTLTRTGSSSKTASLTLGADQVITGTLTLNGNSAVNRLLITSDVLGTPRTLTAATVVASRADFRDITGAGAGSWNLAAITGNSGDCGGNSGITFTTPATQTATGTASFTWSTHGWTSRVPLPQDDVVISNAFVSGCTVTLDMPRAGKSIDWSGATWSGTAPIWAKTVATTIYGSTTLKTGMTNSGTTSVTKEGRGAFTLTTAGVTLTNPIIVAMVGGTLTLLDALSSTSTFTHNNGTFVDGGFATTFTTATSNSGLTRVLTRTGNLTVTGTGAVLTITATGLTHTGTGSTITISETTQGTSKTFAGGGLTTYGNITFSGKNILVTGANTFATMALNNLGDTTGVTLPASTTTTVTDFTSTASVGNVAKLISSLSGTAATLSKASGIVSVDYCSLKDSAATGGAAWYAGANSTNVSGNTGWSFTALLTHTLTGLLASSGPVVKGIAKLLTGTV